MRLSHRPHSPGESHVWSVGRGVISAPLLKFACTWGTVPWEPDPPTALCTFRACKRDGGGAELGPEGWRVRTPCWDGGITVAHYLAGLGPRALVA